MAADGPSSMDSPPTNPTPNCSPDPGRNPAVANKQERVCDNNQGCACGDVIERKYTHTHTLPFKESPPSHDGKKRVSGITNVIVSDH